MGYVKQAGMWHEVPDDPGESIIVQRPRPYRGLLASCCGQVVVMTTNPTTGQPWAAPIDDDPMCTKKKNKGKTP